MDAYRVLLVALCLTVLGVSQEVGARTLPVEGDQVVNISGRLAGVPHSYFAFNAGLSSCRL
jgi:hypothetical protein